jgi:hypothetical protein
MGINRSMCPPTSDLLELQQATGVDVQPLSQKVLN